MQLLILNLLLWSVVNPFFASWEEDDLVAGATYRNFYNSQVTFKPDFEDGMIMSRRDLEDFQRLWIKVDTDLLEDDQVILSWTEVTSASPAVQIYASADTSGGTSYLTDSTVKQLHPYANGGSAQTDLYTSTVYGKAVGIVSAGTSLTLPVSWVWEKDTPRYLLFEGTSRGKGALKVSIKRGNQTIDGGKVYMDLKDIKEMYERWTVGDTDGGELASQATLATDSLPQGASVFSYTAQSPEDMDYILFVHGWNMEPWEKDRFAETAYKRLYWQGYKGRFGSFRWPTRYGFSKFPDAFIDRQHYDESEKTAWDAAALLKNFFLTLDGAYGGIYHGKVRVFAHSTGNAMVGLSLQQLTEAGHTGTNQVVHTYAACNAQVTAHCYDAANADSLTFQFDHPWILLDGTINYGPTTPNIYPDILGMAKDGAGKIVNFYNRNDWAVGPNVWEYDQITKPDSGFLTTGTDYRYVGTPDDLAPWTGFQKWKTVGVDPLGNPIFDWVPLDMVVDLHEIMAFAAEARVKAIGTTTMVEIPDRVENEDLWVLWGSDPDVPDDDPLKKFSRHKEHSWIFRSTNMKQGPVWNQMLFQFGFQPQGL